MPLTDDQFAVLRVWVGADVDDSVLEDRYTRLGSFDSVVIEELNAQLAELQGTPSSISVGGLSISFGEQIRALQDAIKRFRASGGTGLDVDGTLGFATARLKRADLR